MKKIMATGLLLASFNLFAADCKDVPSFKDVQPVLAKVQAEANGGFGLHMWAVVVNRSGAVCSVNFSGKSWGDQWPGSRIIAAQKAYTANAFSLPGLALSTANLYSAVQPGGSLFGLQMSNPVDTAVAYKGDAKNWGTTKDELVGKRMGGVNVFGGGLALYNSKGALVGALGLSGDSSCADHVIAWKMRHALKMDFIPAGVSPAKDDNIIYLADKEAVNGFKHPVCGGSENKVELPAKSTK
ncbi:MAG: GlcG/HbpS family heme-binding protein [Bacteriovorax sp.]